MLSNANISHFNCKKSRFFGGVYPEFLEGPQNDILINLLSG